MLRWASPATVPTIFFSAKGGFKLKLTLYLKKVETYPHNDVNHDGSNAIVLGRRFLCPEEHDA
jgi:hypothetical protein